MPSNDGYVSAIEHPYITLVVWGILLFAIPTGGICLSISNPDNFYAWWESCALIAHLVLFCWWFWEIFFARHNLAPCLRDKSVGLMLISLALMVLCVSGACIAAFGPFNWGWAWAEDRWIPIHTSLLLIASISVLAVNLLVGFGGDTNQKCCSGTNLSVYHFESASAKESIWVIDIPTVVAFSIVSVFTWVWWYLGKQIEEDYLKPFIAGAVAFQVTFANVAFLFARLRREKDAE